MKRNVSYEFSPSSKGQPASPMYLNRRRGEKSRVFKSIGDTFFKHASPICKTIGDTFLGYTSPIETRVSYISCKRRRLLSIRVSFVILSKETLFYNPHLLQICSKETLAYLYAPPIAFFRHSDNLLLLSRPCLLSCTPLLAGWLAGSRA